MKQKPIQATAHQQAKPWERYTFIPAAAQRDTWQLACDVRQAEAAKEREKHLDALYEELRANDDPYRWKVLEKLSDTRKELIRVGGVSNPCDVAVTR